MDDTNEMSDAAFLKWAQTHPQRWALLPGDRRERWLDHLIARMRATTDPGAHREYWRLATAIANADRYAGARTPGDS